MFQIVLKALANDLMLKNQVELADKTPHAPRKSRNDSLHLKESKKQFNSAAKVSTATASTALRM
ncbi:MAG: hypothetical protein ACOX7G_00715 [Candidatus Scatomorpha sp.]